MGPTASGKTALGISLAERLKADIICVDSVSVYKSLDIGSAKPSKEELAKVKHHLIDLCDPAENYSAADFCVDAKAKIVELASAGKTPILVGGTMLYFKALLEGLSEMPATDETVRKEVELEAAAIGWPAMHKQLASIDPEYAATLHPNHSQRIGRAIEVFRMSGKTMTELRASSSGEGLLTKFNWLQIAIAPKDRQVLHRRIEKRFDQMLESGLVDEVRRLFERGDLDKRLPSIRAVGYRQIWEYLEGNLSYSEMREKGIAATRQLAKRQLTWLRSWPDLCWIHTQDKPGKGSDSNQIVNDALNFLPERTI